MATCERFGYCIEPAQLPLSAETLKRIEELEAWHDTALRWNDPAAPGPWRQEECERFNKASEELFAQINCELGPGYLLGYEQEEMREDPELDSYLSDPDGFWLRKRASEPREADT
jgi:hypothetical protein